MASLALSDSFEYLCYGSTTIENICILTLWGSTLDVRILRLYRRQILTIKADPRAVRVEMINIIRIL